ncbi:hypothetical protein NP493_374g00006 [Ridgeia piscesae]|uniref:Uncharacterized protein n=1 Tax=Ridgeia piscesae TaxID=27915 RepID=A0AAD9L2B9_RIDPI|nr:hypothetical protein NP493_374g00006 [Ridgeia piscesae]
MSRPTGRRSWLAMSVQPWRMAALDRLESVSQSLSAAEAYTRRYR